MSRKDTNMPLKSKSVSALDVSPLLKEVYPKPKKKKRRSKRFERISRLMGKK